MAVFLSAGAFGDARKGRALFGRPPVAAAQADAAAILHGSIVLKARVQRAGGAQLVARWATPEVAGHRPPGPGGEAAPGRGADLTTRQSLRQGGAVDVLPFPFEGFPLFVP